MLPHKTIIRFIYQLPVLKQIVGVGMGEKGGGTGGNSLALFLMGQVQVERGYYLIFNTQSIAETAFLVHSTSSSAEDTFTCDFDYMCFFLTIN